MGCPRCFQFQFSSTQKWYHYLSILGAFYALRVGQELVPSWCNPRLMQGVVDILRLPLFSKDEDDDKRTQQLKLSLVSLLIYSDPTFGDYLLLEADDAVDNFLTY
jgi:hypothetical protein